MNALQTIQQKLKAPRSQFNKFGGYNYRNQEDILEAVKPLLTETNSALTITDEVVEIGGSLFVKSTALLFVPDDDNNRAWSTTAYAMHAKEQRGMNEAQITGAASSYARKYALNGLFLIDDTKDADATNDGKKDKKEPKPEEKISTTTPTTTIPNANAPTSVKELPWLNEGTKEFESVSKRVFDGVPVETFKQYFRLSKKVTDKLNEIKKPAVNGAGPVPTP